MGRKLGGKIVDDELKIAGAALEKASLCANTESVASFEVPQK